MNYFVVCNDRVVDVSKTNGGALKIMKQLKKRQGDSSQYFNWSVVPNKKAKVFYLN